MQESEKHLAKHSSIRPTNYMTYIGTGCVNQSNLQGLERYIMDTAYLPDNIGLGLYRMGFGSNCPLKEKPKQYPQGSERSVPADMEIAFLPYNRGGLYPGVYLYTNMARMMRPVRQLIGSRPGGKKGSKTGSKSDSGGGALELLGTLEQNNMSIRWVVLKWHDNFTGLQNVAAGRTCIWVNGRMARPAAGICAD